MKQTSSGEVVIDFRNVTKRFKSLTAVNDVSLQIRRGQFVALLGPNGAGKTTLVEMLEGLKQPDSGTIHILGRQWSDGEKQLRMKISGVLQEPLFVNKLRVIETLHLFGSFYKLPRKRSEEVLETVELEAKRTALVGTLSGGQRQRLALGVALLNEPEIMVLDEPTTGLDPQARRMTWEVLRKLNVQHSATMILTTHYMEEAEFLCDRICIMHKGRILTEGTLPELLKAHRSGEIVEYRIRGNVACDELEREDSVISYHFDSATSRARVRVHDASEYMSRLYGLVREKRIDIDEIMIRKNSLDDLFLALAGREFHE